MQWKLLVIVVFVLAVVIALVMRYIARERTFIGGALFDEDSADLGETEGGARPISFPLREPWFEKLRSGEKKSEARLNRGAYAKVLVGDTVEIRRSRPKDDTKTYEGLRKFRATVTERTEYPSFEEWIKAEGVKDVLPGIRSVDKAVEHYREFYTAEDEKAVGVVAFKFKIAKSA